MLVQMGILSHLTTSNSLSEEKSIVVIEVFSNLTIFQTSRIGIPSSFDMIN